MTPYTSDKNSITHHESGSQQSLPVYSMNKETAPKSRVKDGIVDVHADENINWDIDTGQYRRIIDVCHQLSEKNLEQLLTIAKSFATPEVYSQFRGILEEEILTSDDKQVVFKETSNLDDIFAYVIDNIYEDYEGKSGRKPVRLERLKEVFLCSDDEYIPLDKFADQFRDTTNPRKSASNALSWLNNVFCRLDVDIEIHSRQVGGTKAYKLRAISRRALPR